MGPLLNLLMQPILAAHDCAMFSMMPAGDNFMSSRKMLSSRTTNSVMASVLSQLSTLSTITNGGRWGIRSVMGILCQSMT